jgi:hypothetical protein
MEFRRVEIKKSLKYREFITAQKEARAVFERLKEKDLRFSMRLSSVGPVLGKCVVQGVGEGGLTFFSGFPRKIQTTVDFKEVEMVEVESNCELLVEEPDDGGRWLRIM